MKIYKNISLYFNTIKYLRWQQVYFRIIRKLFKPKVTDKFSDFKHELPGSWQHLILYEESLDNKLNSSFLNISKKLDLPNDWNNDDSSKLWTYNLHYFEDLLANNAKKKSTFHLQLLDRWANDNPIGYGNGWEPYPISIRIVNVLKAWLGGLDLNDKLFKSLFNQASYLSNDLERHLLGNHYFVNLKALLFSGVIFGNSRWLKIADEGLLTEIHEQILDDGANFELSPMYHSLILVDMLDMINLSRAYPGQISNQLSSLLKYNIPKMLAYMENLAHPDGGVSFFNDSVNGIAPIKEKIETYAKKLGFKINSLDSNELQIIDNSDSGYICAIVDRSKLIFDASPIGPDYIPGHGHADTLSFELSIGPQRVFVNSGISKYGLSSTRLNQRKTKSHNTVEVDRRDSSQVWSGFRVAKRAKIIERGFNLILNKSIVLQAKHDGYKSLFGGCYHFRKLVFSNGCLVVQDKLQGSYKEAKSRLYFHPDLKVSLDNDFLVVLGNNFKMECNLSGKNASLFDSVWHPEFGIDICNKGLLIDIDSGEAEICFKWVDISKVF